MKKEKAQKLLFIYNATSGKLNAVWDGIHKIFSPNSYPCSLCAITYGVVGENKLWKKFRNEAHMEMEFLHRDEFLKSYASKFGHKFTFPIVLSTGKGELEVAVTTEELNQLKSAEELITVLQKHFRVAI